MTVTAAEDEDAESETTILRHQQGGATVRNGLVTVTVNDNDTRGVWLSETKLKITEDSTGTYDIALTTEPTGPVTVTVRVTVSGTSGDVTDVTVSPSQVSFTPSTWSEPKSIMVRVANDDDAENDPTVTLKHTVSGGGYDVVSPSSVTVTVEDNDTRGVRLYDHEMELEITELKITEGSTGTYRIALNTEPTGTVTVTVSGASGDVTVRPSRVILTSSTWADGQDVVVRTAHDDDAEQDPAVTLKHTVSGGGYDGVRVADMAVTITEDEELIARGVTVSPRQVTIVEGSVGSAYTLVLKTRPTGRLTVIVGVEVGNAENSVSLEKAALTVRPRLLAFTPSDWNQPQQVTLIAAEDDDAVDSIVSLTHTPSGGSYADLNVSSVRVEVVDNDMLGMTVTPAALEIAEGTSETFTVVLDAEPPVNGDGDGARSSVE